MTYNSDLLVELEIERLQLRNRPRAERAGGNQGMSPAIRMRIGDWYVDEHGILSARSRRATSRGRHQVRPQAEALRLPES